MFSGGANVPSLEGATIIKMKRKIVMLGSVHLGQKFMFRTAEVLGGPFRGRKPPFEGEVVTVVGFEPRYKNQVVVRDVRGEESLLPLEEVENLLKHRE